MFCVDLGQTANFALQNIKRSVIVTEVQIVYYAVRTDSLYKADTFQLIRVNKGGKEIIPGYW